MGPKKGRRSKQIDSDDEDTKGPELDAKEGGQEKAAAPVKKTSKKKQVSLEVGGIWSPILQSYRPCICYYYTISASSTSLSGWSRPGFMLGLLGRKSFGLEVK